VSAGAGAPAVRVGLDFDNTLACYDALFHRLACERGLLPAGVPESKRAVRDALRARGLEDAWTELQGVAYAERLLEAPPFAGAREFLGALRRAGASVCVISHKTRYPVRGPRLDLHAAARGWLAHAQLLDAERTGLSLSEVWFEPSAAAKRARIAERGCTHFVDDLPEFLLAPDFPAGVARIHFAPEGGPAREGLLPARSFAELERLVLRGGAA
jgi:hypothetical protein